MKQYLKDLLHISVKLLIDFVKAIFNLLGDILKKNLWIVILLFAANYAIDHKLNLNFLKKVTTDESTRLKTEDGEVASAIIYMDDHIIIIQKAGEEPKQYIGVKKAKLTKFDDGEVQAELA